MRTMKGHKAPVNGLDFSPDGARLVSADANDRFMVWDAADGSVADELHAGSWVNADVAFAPGGEVVLFSGYQSGVWMTPGKSFQPLGETRSEIGTRVAVHPRGDRFAMCGGFSTHHSPPQSVRIWTWPGLARVEVPDTEWTTGGLAYHPEGHSLAAGYVAAGDGGRQQYRYPVHLMDPDTGRSGARLQGATAPVTDLAFSPDGTNLAGLAGINLLIWDVADRRLIARRKVGRLHFKGLAFTPDGRFLLTVSNDKTTRVWETATWTEYRTFEWQVGRARSIAVAPDGMRAAVGGGNGSIVIWDLDV